jgi:hypothetical protein
MVNLVLRNAVMASLTVVAITAAIPSAQARAPEAAAGEALFDTIAALDTAVFDAFNHCDAPGQLEKHEAFFDPAVEFYHDNGGVTWTREAMIGNTRKYVCGHFGRKLVPGSLHVYPIKDFGAIETGVHEFCQFDSKRCEGRADFTIVWRLKDGVWQITRVLSYGHRENP